MNCCVCTDPDVDSPNGWLCSPCQAGIVEPRCVLCCQIAGAMKRTTNGEWVHAICALFTEGVFFEDANDMKPVNLAGVSESKKNKTCAYCLKAVGFCGLCAKSKCKTRIHVTCAQTNKCTIEVKRDRDDTIDFRAYCLEHRPSKSKRRISSKFVAKVVAKKRTKALKSKHAASANQNSDWIKDAHNLMNENGKRPAKETEKQSNTPVEMTKSHSNIQTIANGNGKENAMTKKHTKEPRHRPVGTSKSTKSNAASVILQRIENKMHTAQNQTIPNEIIPVGSSAPKNAKEANRTDVIKGMMAIYIQ